jgi:hypothetical protein
VAERVLGQFKRTQIIERIDPEDQTTSDYYIESALTDSYPDSASETKKGLLRLAASKVFWEPDPFHRVFVVL